jgi:cobalt-zinc-cadmium efflux system membrane fusion protein
VSGFAVTAPFAGTVIEKKVTLGELATPSEPMFTVADLSRVWIQAALPEAALSKVRVGASAKVTVPAYPGESLHGQGRPHRRHARQGHAHRRGAHRSSRMPTAGSNPRCLPPPPSKRWVRNAKPLLPDAAIVLLEGKPTIFVFEQGAYEAREVEPGERIAGRTVLKSGVKPATRWSPRAPTRSRHAS